MEEFEIDSSKMIARDGHSWHDYPAAFRPLVVESVKVAVAFYLRRVSVGFSASFHFVRAPAARAAVCFWEVGLLDSANINQKCTV